MAEKKEKEIIGYFTDASAQQKQAELRDAEPYYNRGNVYDEKGQLDQAISDFTKALEINPSYVEAYTNRGFVYLKKSQKKTQGHS